MGVRGNYTGGIVRNGLVVLLDAGKVDSYPKVSNLWNDIGVNTNNSTLNGGYTFSSSDGGSVQLNGTTAYVTCGLAQSIGADPFSPFSMVVWSKKIATIANTPQTIVERYQGITLSYRFGWQIVYDTRSSGFSEGDITIHMNNSQWIDSYITATNSNPVNQWKHITFTYDGSVGYLYVDGNLMSSANRPTPHPSGGISANSRNLNLGYLSVHNSQFLNGNIAQLLVYNRTLTATEVMQNFTATRSRFVSKGIDSDSQNFLNAAMINNAQIANAVNNLVLDLKKFGLWSKMRAIYPIVGGNAWSHKFNLKDPRDADSAYRLFFSGSWTHGSTGMTPSSAYANTYFIPVNNSSLNSSHVSFYSRTNSDGGSGAYTSYVDIGGSNQLGSAGGTGLALRTSDIFSGRVDVYPNSASDAATASNTDSRGFYIASRTSSTSTKIYKNGLIVGSNSTAGNRSTKSLLISADSKDNPDQIVRYSNRQSAFITIGDGLTDTESANFYTAVQAFQTLLGRQV